MACFKASAELNDILLFVLIGLKKGYIKKFQELDLGTPRLKHRKKHYRGGTNSDILHFNTESRMFLKYNFWQAQGEVVVSSQTSCS